MNAHDEPLGRHIDAAIDVVALLLRAGAYLVIALAAERFDCGRALRTGIVTGDLAASVLALALQRRDCLAQAFAELALLALVFLWVKSRLVWPHEPPDRAILGLTAFGVFAARAGRAVMARLGPGEN